MKKTTIRNLIYSLIVLMLFGAVMLVLTHTAQNGMETTQILPQINPEPVYVTCEAGETLEVTLTAKEDFQSSGFQVLLVNIAQDSRGTVRFAVTDEDSSILVSQVIPVETITPGKWFTIDGGMTFAAGQSYELSLRTAVLRTLCRCLRGRATCCLLPHRSQRTERFWNAAFLLASTGWSLSG